MGYWIYRNICAASSDTNTAEILKLCEYLGYEKFSYGSRQLGPCEKHTDDYEFRKEFKAISIRYYDKDELAQEQPDYVYAVFNLINAVFPGTVVAFQLVTGNDTTDEETEV